MNIVVAIGFWFWGPWDQGAMSGTTLAGFAALAIVSLGAAVYLARSVNGPPSLPTPIPSSQT